MSKMNDLEAMVEISFIIPAYNSEHVIRRCIESVVSDAEQTAANYEVIIVENGSTDSTFLLANDLSKKHKSVKVLRSKKGVSKARNRGILESKGRIIVFLDADDLLLPGAANTILSDWKRFGTDLIQYAYLKDEKKILHKYSPLAAKINDNTLEDVKAWFIRRPTLRMQAWGKAFNGELVRNKRILFDEDLVYSEDSEFVIRYLKEIKSIVISNSIIYRYCTDFPSAMRSYNSNKAENYIKSLSKSRDFLALESGIISDAFREYVLINLNVILVNEVFSKYTDQSFWKRLKEMKKILNRRIFHDNIEHIKTSRLLTIQLLPELFFKNNLNLAGGIICYIKACINKAHYGYKNRLIPKGARV